MNRALIGRGVLALLAIMSVVLSSAGILSVGVTVVIVAGAFFLAVTNFGRSCPLFLSLRSLLKRKRFQEREEQE
jgi:hypothetical protein